MSKCLSKLTPVSMTKRGQEIVEAIKAGNSFYFAGDKVIVTNIAYNWQTPMIWLVSSNGSAHIASWNEINSASITFDKSLIYNNDDFSYIR